MQLMECLYYAECEGLLPTRAGKINAVIQDIKDYPAPAIEMDIFESILNDHGLSYNDLSQSERNYIDVSIS